MEGTFKAGLHGVSPDLRSTLISPLIATDKDN